MEQNSDVAQRILQAARKLFFANGYAKTQLRVIASKAGTSESGVLRIFESKMFLLRAVCDSCWAEINAEVERAVVEASERDSDPRNLLLEIMRTVLQFAQTNKPLMTFLYTHFASPEAIGYVPQSEGFGAPYLSSVGREFQRYYDGLERLCTAAVENNPGFGAAGVTPQAMQVFVQAGIYGVQASWYIVDQSQMPDSYRISIEEMVACLRCFLYQNATDQSFGGCHGF
jgi:AcrR family transcriptional regulator